jgi:putative ABC transport system permease protein
MRGRAIMTAMGVLIGTAAIVVLVALASGLQKSTTESFSDFGAVNQITVFGGFRTFGGGDSEESPILNQDALLSFSRMEGVTAVTPYVSVNARSVNLNRLTGSLSITGVDPRVVDDLGLTVDQGTNRLGQWTVLVGARASEQLNDPRSPRALDEDPPDLFGQTLIVQLERVNDAGEIVTRRVRLRVTGVLTERGGQEDNSLYISLDNAEELTTWIQGGRVNRDHDGYDQAVIVVNDPEAALKTEQEIGDQGYFAFSARSALQQINIFFSIVQAVFGGIGAISLIVAAIGIANTMIMSILERTREIGLMKAVGASNRDVMSVFITEAGAIGLLGGIGGVLFGIGAAKIIDLIAVAYISGQNAASGSTAAAPSSLVFVPTWLPIFAIGFSVVIGLAAGIYPALRAVQLNPVTALKYE